MTQLTNEAPIACTLGSAELGAQVERWRTLYAVAGTERTPTDDGLRISFRRDAAVEAELRDLVAVETECCKWADWTVDADEAALVLRVNSTGDGVSVIRDWFLA